MTEHSPSEVEDQVVPRSVTQEAGRAMNCLAIGEAAELLGVNRLTIRRWIQTGKLVAYRQGTRVLVVRQQVAQEARRMAAHERGIWEKPSSW